MATVSPLPTESPSETLISFTVPALSAFMLFSIFIASSTSRGWPASTSSPTATSTEMTVPCIGTVMVPLPLPARDVPAEARRVRTA